MSTTTEARRLNYAQKVPRSILNRVAPGSRLRLRADIYKWLKEREWIFNKMESDQIHLLHESRAYGLIVRMEDIDWSKFEEKFVERNRKTLSQRRGLEN